MIDIKNTLIDTKIFSIFIFILIVSANFLAEIFPCRLQNLLRNNMLVKHVFGLFTMIFFVVLSSGSNDKNIYVIIKRSLLLYIIFIFISKCHLYMFYFIMMFLGIAYIIDIANQYNITKVENIKQNNKELSNEELSNEEVEYNKKINNNNNIIYILYVLIFISIFIGIILYMGEKKIEYKNNFNYITFFIGKPKCKGSSPSVDFKNIFKAHLKY
jgi:hypothetical protein